MVVDAVPGQPVVDRLDTRALEHKSLIRGYVAAAEQVSVDATASRFATTDRWSTRHTEWGDAAPRDRSAAHGCLRIDVVSDDVLRIRYRPAAPIDAFDDAPSSPMLVGTSPAATDVIIQATSITTPAMHVTVDLQPLTITVATPDGDEVCRIGGREKNMWGRLLPYLLGEARRSARAGLPMMRALVGEHLLVAPMLTSGSRRRVYLPEGRWKDWWTGEEIDGGQWSVIDVALDHLPTWIRDGGAVATGPMMAHVGERPTDAVNIRALAPADGRHVEGCFVVDGNEISWRWIGGTLEVDESQIRIEIA